MDISPYIIFKYNSAEYIMFLRCEYNKKWYCRCYFYGEYINIDEVYYLAGANFYYFLDGMSALF